MRLISKMDSRADKSILALLTLSGDVQIGDVTSGTMAAPRRLGH